VRKGEGLCHNRDWSRLEKTLFSGATAVGGLDLLLPPPPSSSLSLFPVHFSFLREDVYTPRNLAVRDLFVREKEF